MSLAISIDRRLPIPVGKQLKTAILAYIRQTGLPDGAALPSVQRIAEAAGVSLRTADLALQELVSDGYCFRRPKRGTFVGARSVSQVKSLCGLWEEYSPEDSNIDLTGLSIQRGLTYQMRHSETETYMRMLDPAKDIPFYAGIPSFDFRGMLVYGNRLFLPMLELAKRFPQHRFVFLNNQMAELNHTPDNVRAVVNDDEGGAYALLERYIARGVRSVAVATWPLKPSDLTYEIRIQGFQKAASEYGLEFSQERDLIQCDTVRHGNFQAKFRSSYLAAKRYLQSGRRPDLVAAVNDTIALAFQKCLEEEGLDGQIQVVGYDCILGELVRLHGIPSMRVQYPQMCQCALDMLLHDFQSAPKVTCIPPVFQTGE
ncbi:MAG: substrate-binding domain-containing protein [Victivallales bacterium]|nr:substrate-binding domain-containing protein [Victivallales bacterium]